jgi:hypothetical protein
VSAGGPGVRTRLGAHAGLSGRAVVFVDVGGGCRLPRRFPVVGRHPGRVAPGSGSGDPPPATARRGAGEDVAPRDHHCSDVLGELNQATGGREIHSRL